MSLTTGEYVDIFLELWSFGFLRFVPLSFLLWVVQSYSAGSIFLRYVEFRVDPIRSPPVVRNGLDNRRVRLSFFFSLFLSSFFSLLLAFVFASFSPPRPFISVRLARLHVGATASISLRRVAPVSTLKLLHQSVPPSAL